MPERLKVTSRVRAADAAWEMVLFALLSFLDIYSDAVLSDSSRLLRVLRNGGTAFDFVSVESFTYEGNAFTGVPDEVSAALLLTGRCIA